MSDNNSKNGQLNTDRTTVQVSVRNLVEFVLRSGDIDNRIGKGRQAKAMQEGTRIHRMIQKRMKGDYRSEVPLKILVSQADYDVLVEGRADGIFTMPVKELKAINLPEDETELDLDNLVIDEGLFIEGESFFSDEKKYITVIDEIKGMYTDVSRFEKAIDIHLAQAMCYAYIYAMDHQEEMMGVQVTYCNMDTEDISRFQYVFNINDLQAWFGDVMDKYAVWLDMDHQWKILRQTSISGLEFPFEYREGQKKLVGDVYRTFLRKKNLFIQAPTGTGKTISTVFPAVKAMGEELSDRIFYLTAKTITRTVAKEAFDILKTKGFQAKVITLTAKEKLCLCEEMDCNPVNCEYAKGHFDRVNDCVYDMITHEDDITREVILEYAKNHNVCPFEMMLDASNWSDVIICDYNYLFDPNVYLKRYFAEGMKGDYIFLVDEAHNLVERGRKMYSACLVKEDFLTMKRLLKPYSRKLCNALEKCNKDMLAWKRDCEIYTEQANLGTFELDLMRMASYMDELLTAGMEFPGRKEVTEFYLNVRHFMNMMELYDDNYVLYTDYSEQGEFYLHLYCVNPAKNLQNCLDRGRSTVYFSATLLPINYYKGLLSNRDDDYAVYATSIFDTKNRLLAIANDVSSKYTRRNPSEYKRIAEYIRKTALAKKGNYIVFFPSYRFMNDVFAVFDTLYSEGIDYIVQETGMTESDREAFIEEFSQERDEPLVAFCVMGGIFGEGIDLKNDQLIGALIVGTGLPQVCNEREVLKTYYDNRKMSGFDYAYLYPGMNKVLQAAGRVIRTAEDRGIICLMDDRFLRNDYREMFPREWADYSVERIDTIGNKLEEFWAEKEAYEKTAETPRFIKK